VYNHAGVNSRDHEDALLAFSFKHRTAQTGQLFVKGEAAAAGIDKGEGRQRLINADLVWMGRWWNGWHFTIFTFCFY